MQRLKGVRHPITEHCRLTTAQSSTEHWPLTPDH